MSPVDHKGNYYPGDQARADAKVASTARTTSGVGAAFNTEEAKSFEGFLTVSAHAGTTPTLDVSLETSVDGGTTWQTVGAFAQQTGDGSTSHVFGPLGDQCRWRWAVGGTTPSFTFKVDVEANN